MKNLKKVFFASILTLLVGVVPLFPAKASVVEMPRDESRNESIKEFVKSDDFQIHLIGHTDALENNEHLKNKVQMTDIDHIKSNKKYNSIWITEENHQEFLNSGGIKKLDKYLNKGYSIYFLGLHDQNVLGDLLYEQKFEETLKDNSIQQQAAFITKNKSGEVYTGVFLSEENYSNNDLLDTIMASAWNRKNDFNYTKKGAEISFIDKVSKKVFANSGDDFNIGSDWRSVYPWTQYSISTAWGTETEWKAGYYLKNPSDGQNYYAMAIEAAMDPTYDDSALSLQFISDADSNSQANKLKQYNPKVSPTSNTMTFSVGGSISKSDGAAGDISASWTVTKDDLRLADSSSPSYQKMNITFNYDSFSYYAKQTTWQNLAFVYLAPSGSTYCKLDNYRKATFLTGGGTILSDSKSSYYVTTVYK